MGASLVRHNTIPGGELGRSLMYFINRCGQAWCPIPLLSLDFYNTLLLLFVMFATRYESDH